MALEINPEEDSPIINHNIVMNGFGPQLLLLETMFGTKGKTRQEINDTAKYSSHSELTNYYEHMKIVPKLKDFKIRLGSFATSEAT